MSTSTLSKRELLAQLLKEKARNASSLEPLSRGQRALWLEYQLAPQSAAYNIMYQTALVDGTNLDTLRKAFGSLIARHGALRTTFELKDGEPVRKVHGLRDVPMEIIDVATWTQEAIDQWLEAEADTPFVLEEGPLFRITVLQNGREWEKLMVMTLHHIVVDFWSLDVMIEELCKAYASLNAGQPVTLPKLSHTYKDYVTHERTYLERNEDKLWDFWKERLAGELPVLNLPTDRPRGARRYRGNSIAFEVSAQTCDALRALSRQSGVTLYTLMLTAYQTLLMRYSGQKDLIVGSPMSSRDRAEWETLMGYFVNLVPLRGDLSGNPSFLELARKVQDNMIDTMDHRNYPFPSLVERLQPKRDPSRSPVFQVCFVWDEMRKTEPSAEKQALLGQQYASGQRGSIFEFVLTLHASEGAMHATCEYNTDLFDESTARRIAGNFNTLAAAVAANPETQLSQLPLLSDDERAGILQGWNDTDTPYSRERCMHQLFEASVDRDAAAKAVVYKGTELSYGDVENRANQLADLLLTEAAPLQHVAVCLDRSHHMITSVLGIHKAGAAYVPLDPDWPAERLHLLLGMPGLNTVITNRDRLPMLQQLQYRLPQLQHIICIDNDAAEIAPEPVVAGEVSQFWDSVVENAEGNDITVGGFVSAYTGAAWPREEVEAYCNHVRQLAQPHLDGSQRVLEIGCGAGHLMEVLAPMAASYTGIDPSAKALAYSRELADRQGWNVELQQGFAHDLSGEQTYDLIVVASTVQFFPGYNYLSDVINKALGQLAPGGTILLVDLIDARLKEDFRSSLLAFQETNKDNPEMRTKTNLDSEFYLDEQYLLDLGATHTELADTQILRRTGFHNELRFRFDAALRKRRDGEEAITASPVKNLWTGVSLDDRKTSRPQIAYDANAQAYTIYTSGSTGAPKGVMVRHEPAINLIEWVNQTFGVNPTDRLLFVTSLCFDLSVYDIFGILAAGATIQVADKDDLRDGEGLVATLYKDPITFWDSAPAAMQALAAHFPQNPPEGSNLRLVFFSGDWIPVSLPDRVRNAFAGSRVISLGGATEATIWSNFYPIGDVDPDWPSIPYGRPIQNAQYYVLDQDLEPVPVGVTGDLYIGGDCLAAGYAGAAIKTADKFLPDPFGKSGGRIYRTGDLARFFADGNIEFLGRGDHQVKIRGYRIELGEIEAILRAHPQILETVVLAREDGGDKRLVAYVMPKAGEAAPPVAEMRNFLKEQIPEYMVPAAFVVLDAFPVTANGKVDRASLPAPDSARRQEDEDFTPPKGETEEWLAALWSQTLELDLVGVEDNFFELGGHSLMLTTFPAKLEERFGVRLSMMDLFRNPTIRTLAKRLQATDEKKPARATRTTRRSETRASANKLRDKRRGARRG